MPKYPKLISKKIKYNSPSGEIIIGKYIPPFENNSTGFGFKGVLIEDVGTGKLQCCECGYWCENLSTHIFAKHHLTALQYKMKFGLLQSTALKSKRLRLRQCKVMIELRKKYKQCNMTFNRNNCYASNRKNKPKAVESQNKYGVCRLQLIARIKELSKEMNGKTPTLLDLKDRYGAIIMTLLHERFGSYVQLCRKIGLDPVTSRANPKYSREYFIEKILSNEPNFRIFTVNEGRALYKYFPGGMKELKEFVAKIK